MSYIIFEQFNLSFHICVYKMLYFVVVYNWPNRKHKTKGDNVTQVLHDLL